MSLTILPIETGKRLSFEHFPDPLCAFVFRNWDFVEAKRMADVVGASEEEIIQLGGEMGLDPRPVDERWLSCGYLTVIRSNWHLLDYEQICFLLGWPEEKLAFVLKEEDGLGIKLGNFKPDTGKLLWHDFDRSSLPRIKAATAEFYGKLPPEAEKPFDFVPRFEAAAALGASDGGRRGTERIVYPYCALYGDTFVEGLDFSFPESLLRAYETAGVTGVWCQAVLYKLAPFPFEPSLSDKWEERLSRMKALTERMAKHGIKLYLYLNEPRSMPKSFFETHPELKGEDGEDGDACLCTSVPAVQKYLYEAAAVVSESVPLLGGFFTIVASENRTNCYSKKCYGKNDERPDCPRCRNRKKVDVMAEVNELLYRGAASRNPSIRFIAWDWGMDHATALQFAEALPSEIAVMGVSEQAVEKTIAGIRTEVIDYSISIVGPGDYAKSVWRRARETGHPLFAKCQFNNTWECSFVPFLPAFRQIYTHMKRLREEELDGLFLSWTLGGFPSLTFRLLLPIFDEPTVPSLRDLYERVFPAETVDPVAAACESFSEAFDKFPFDLDVLYNAPQNSGPADLLYRKPTGFRATMVGYPYDDLAGWTGRFTPEILEEQFKELSELWGKGLEILQTLPDSAFEKGSAVRELWDSAEAAYCHFRSTFLQIRFVRIRDGLCPGDADEIRAIAKEEASLALRLAAVQRGNPCIGYESSNHYFYHTQLLAEKYLNCLYPGN